MASDPRSIGAALRRARERDGRYNISQVADKLKTSRQYITNLERGDRDPSMDMLRKLAEAYRCEIGDLLPTSTPTNRELEPLIAAIYEFPGDHGAIIRETASFIRFLHVAGGKHAVDTATKSANNGKHIPQSGDSPSLPVGLDDISMERAGGKGNSNNNKSDETELRPPKS